MNIKEGKLIYHLTDFNNLESIIKNGLLSRAELKKRKSDFSDIANQDIISKRTELNLDDYVPFHFYPYSPFDAAVKYNNKDKEFIYLCISREVAKDNGFYIIPIHPLSSKEVLMKYDEGFEEIDWDCMNQKGVDSDHVKHVKMAECLYKNKVDMSMVLSIGVKNENIKNQVITMLHNYGYDNIHVNIQNTWFSDGFDGVET